MISCLSYRIDQPNEVEGLEGMVETFFIRRSANILSLSLCDFLQRKTACPPLCGVCKAYNTRFSIQWLENLVQDTKYM